MDCRTLFHRGNNIIDTEVTGCCVKLRPSFKAKVYLTGEFWQCKALVVGQSRNQLLSV